MFTQVRANASVSYTHRALKESKGNVRLAIAMILLDCDSSQAKKALMKVNGRIQDLIDEEE